MSDTKYCYPNSSVLKNKLGIMDENKLLITEIKLTSNRMIGLQVRPVKGNFDFKHLCGIHKRIFQDLFTWAGQPRTVDIGKGNLFCRPQNIYSYADFVFSEYYSKCQNAKYNPDQFTHVLAEQYANLNALHPFREGNGRAQREFARELCLQCGYTFDLTGTTHKEMLQASIESFNGRNQKLEHIFQKAVKPITE